VAVGGVEADEEVVVERAGDLDMTSTCCRLQDPERAREKLFSIGEASIGQERHRKPVDK